MLNFEDWFEKATGHKPYPFQVHFACDQTLLQNPSPLEGEGEGEGGAMSRGLTGQGFGRG